MNTVNLVGNLTKDPELTQTNNGVSVARFSVAVTRKFKNANGEYESDFINCVAWRNTGEFIHKYFNKGNKIGVVGSIQTRNYEAQDGTKRYVTEVLVDQAEFIERKQKKVESKPKELDPTTEDDLPF